MRNRPPRSLAVAFVVFLLVFGSTVFVSDGVVRAERTGGTQQSRTTCDFSTLYDRSIDSVVSVGVETSDAVGEGSGFVYERSGSTG